MLSTQPYHALLYLLLCLSGHTSASPAHFRSWFHGFGDYFHDKLQESCQQEYQAYLANSSCPSSAGFGCADVNVVNCLLDTTDEYVKANLGVGTVVLGLLPTVLSFSGSTTNEVGLLALRRPLLATLLAMSSPAIYPTRALDYEDSLAVLRKRSSLIKVPSSRSMILGSSIIQYMFALAATVNVATQIWTLCVNSPSAMGPSFLFWPLLWPIITLVVHIVGAAYVSRRVQLVSKAATLMDRAKMEVWPCASHEHYVAPVRGQTLPAVLLAWLASVATIIHIIYGTVALSSLLFVSAVDAVSVSLRLLASAVVARVIVMYELSAVSASVELVQDGSQVQAQE